MEGERKRVVSFEDMEVFQRAYRVSLEIHRVSLGFPAVEQRALADQIRRHDAPFGPSHLARLLGVRDRRQRDRLSRESSAQREARHQDHGVVHPPDHYWIKPEALRRPSALLDMAVPAGV